MINNFKFFYDEAKELIHADWVWGDRSRYSSDEYIIEDTYYLSFNAFLSAFHPTYTVLILRIRLRYDNNEYLDITEENYLSYLDELTTHQGEYKIQWMNFDIL